MKTYPIAAVASLCAFSATPALADCDASQEAFRTEIVAGDMSADHFRPLVRDLRELHRAAQILQTLGEEDACEEVMEAMRDIAEDPPDNVGLRKVSDIGGKLRVDEVLDAEVRSSDNEYLGAIDDMVLDSDGQPSYIVVEYGGFLGLGEEQVVIPFETLQVSADRDSFFIPVTEDQFEEAPRFKRDGFDWADDETWRSEVDSFFVGSADVRE